MLLQTMGGEALNNKKFITQMGDAAAMAGKDIKDVARWVGRAYASLKSGSGAGEGASMLSETGILNPEEFMKLKKLGRDAANFGETWKIVLGALDRANGAMERLSKTGGGLGSTMKGLVSLGAAEVFKGFAEQIKGALYTINTKLNELRNSGALAEWGTKVAKITGQVINFVWQVGTAWQNLSKDTKHDLKSMVAYLGVFLVAWKSGLIGAMLSTLAYAVPLIVSNLGLIAVGLTALGSFILGFKLGSLLDDALGLSGLVTKVAYHLTAIKDVFGLILAKLVINVAGYGYLIAEAFKRGLTGRQFTDVTQNFKKKMLKKWAETGDEIEEIKKKRDKKLAELAKQGKAPGSKGGHFEDFLDISGAPEKAI